MDARSSLSELILKTALNSPQLLASLNNAVEEISSAIGETTNEATVSGVFERILYRVLNEIGIKFHPQKEQVVEFQAIRHLGTGKVDSRLGAIVIEYKRPSQFRTFKQQQVAKDQLLAT